MKDKKGKSEKPDSVAEVMLEFEARKPNLTLCCEKTKHLIEECLEAAEIRVQSVQARVKTAKKLKEKYSNTKKKYKKLDDITDLAALRIITYYDDEIDAVVNLVNKEFSIDKSNSNFERVSDPEKFGYDAINLVCLHAKKRRKNVEYNKIKSIKFEIQITSILGHAWAEMNHDWYDLQDSYPVEIKRRFSRMRALLEVAESEFLTLRDKRNDYQKSLGVRIEAGVTGIPIDAVSLKSFIEQDPTVAKVDGTVTAIRKRPLSISVNERLAEALVDLFKDAKLNRFEDLVAELNKFEGAIVELTKLTQPFAAPKMETPKTIKGVSLVYLCILRVAKDGGSQKALAMLKKMRAERWLKNKVHLGAAKIAKKVS